MKIPISIRAPRPATLSLVLLLLPVLPAAAQQEAPALKEASGWVEIPGERSSVEGQSGYLRGVGLVRPAPALTLAELETLNPKLGKALPGLAGMLESAEVSSRFGQLYDAKFASLKAGRILTTHNYFDCETILRLESAGGRKVLLLQADMDVVTDGSDGVRQPKLADYNLARTSDWFLPQTAYSWAGKGSANPFLAYYPATLKKLEALKKQLEAEAANDPGGRLAADAPIL